MSSESKDNMDIDGEATPMPAAEILDEYQIAFDELEEFETQQTSISPLIMIEKYTLLLKNDRFDDSAVKVKESILYKLAKLYTEAKDFDAVLGVLRNNNEFFGVIPKARTAKIVRNILEIVAKVPDSLSVQIRLCRDVVEWCKAEKRTFLRQRIEAKVSNLLTLYPMV
jgi:hypothetical protein